MQGPPPCSDRYMRIVVLLLLGKHNLGHVSGEAKFHVRAVVTADRTGTIAVRSTGDEIHALIVVVRVSAMMGDWVVAKDDAFKVMVVGL
eukprot:6309213-Pyramimonas_sp.AAC.1